MDDIELLTFEDMESMENSLEDLATSITNTSQHNSDSHSSNSSSTPTNYSSSSTSASVATKRISPLRGNMPHDELISQTRTVRNGLSALRDDHYNILAGIRDEYENQRNDNQNNRNSNESTNVTNNDTDVDSSGGLQENVDDSLEARVANVTASLEKLEVGIEESSVMLALSEHFTRMETDREGLRLEVGRVNEENEWLREELSDTQKRLIEAEAELGMNITYIFWANIFYFTSIHYITYYTFQF